MSAELEKRVENLQAAVNEWLDKTDWVQKASSDGRIPGSLGLHRADAMLRYVRTLEAKVAADPVLGRFAKQMLDELEQCEAYFTDLVRALGVTGSGRTSQRLTAVSQLLDRIAVAQTEAETAPPARQGLTTQDLWQAQLREWPDSVQMTPQQVRAWAERGATLADRYRRLQGVSLAIQYPVHVWYLTKMPTTLALGPGPGVHMGCRFGLEGHEYMSGYDDV